MIEVLIIGYGTVGKNLASELATLNPDIFDKYKTKYNSKKKIIYDVAFVCVDTPYISDDNPCDISEVYNAISENEAKIYSERSKYFYFDSFKMNIISTDTEAQSKNFNGVYHML